MERATDGVARASRADSKQLTNEHKTTRAPHNGKSSQTGGLATGWMGHGGENSEESVPLMAVRGAVLVRERATGVAKRKQPPSTIREEDDLLLPPQLSCSPPPH